MNHLFKSISLTLIALALTGCEDHSFRSYKAALQTANGVEAVPLPHVGYVWIVRDAQGVIWYVSVEEGSDRIMERIQLFPTTPAPTSTPH